MKLNKEKFLEVLQNFEDTTNHFDGLSNLLQSVKDHLTEDNVAEKALLIKNLIDKEEESLIKEYEDSQEISKRIVDSLEEKEGKKLSEKICKEILRTVEDLFKTISLSGETDVNNIVTFKINVVKERYNLLSKEEQKNSLEIKNFEKRKKDCQKKIEENLKKIEEYKNEPKSVDLINQLNEAREIELENERNEIKDSNTSIEEDKENLLSKKVSYLKTFDKKIQDLTNLVKEKSESHTSYLKFFPVWRFFNFIFFGALNSSISKRANIIAITPQEINDLNFTKAKCENLRLALESGTLSSETLKETDSLVSLNNSDDFNKALNELKSFKQKLTQPSEIRNKHVLSQYKHKRSLEDIQLDEKMRTSNIKYLEDENIKLASEIQELPSKIVKLEESNKKILSEMKLNKNSRIFYEAFLDIHDIHNTKLSQLAELKELHTELNSFLTKGNSVPTVTGKAALFKPEQAPEEEEPAKDAMQKDLPGNPK